MTIAFTLPASFNPAEFLTSPRLLTCADASRWLVSTILRKTANRDTDLGGLVRLDSRILRRVIGRESSDVIRALEKGAIETAPYCAGVKCRGFRLAKRYLGDCCVRRSALDPHLIDRLDRERQRLDAEAAPVAMATNPLPAGYRAAAPQHRPGRRCNP